MNPIYLDYNATTPIAPKVREAMMPFLEHHFGNPSSGHAIGVAARQAVVHARQQVADLLSAAADEIVFTSCGTESNNLALKGVLMRRGKPGGHLVISAIEHPAIIEPARFLEQWGFAVTIVGVNEQGIVDPQEVESVLRADTQLVSIMHANNETGVVQPIAEISKICRRRNILLHTDAAQSVGKIPVNVQQLGVDLLTIAGHKIYAPKGIGALYVRRETPLSPVQHGASHERGLRPGTENVPYIVGLGQAAQLAKGAIGDKTEQMAALRDLLHDKLQSGIAKGLTVNGQAARRLPNTLSINFPGVDANKLLQHAADVCASTGAACHSGTTTVSATLAAMGVPAEVARGTVRLSLGWFTQQEDVERAAQLLVEAWTQQQERN